jgi:ABC-type oligopeptide transport system substrate-binding subunit
MADEVKKTEEQQQEKPKEKAKAKPKEPKYELGEVITGKANVILVNGEALTEQEVLVEIGNSVEELRELVKERL